MKSIISVFVVTNIFLSFSINSTGASSAACVAAFESEQANAVAEKRQSVEEFIRSLEVRIEERNNYEHIRKINAVLEQMTPLQREHFETVKQYIKWLVSLGFSNTKAFSIAVNREPFQSLRDEEVKEVKERIEWLMSLGLSGQGALRRVIHEPQDRKPLGLLTVSKLTPEKQQRFEEVKQHITWLMDLGFSGLEAIRISNGSIYELRFTKVTPKRQLELEQIAAKVSELVERFDIPVKTAVSIVVTPVIRKVSSVLSEAGFTDLQISKIIKLGILAERSHILFGREKMSIEEKRELLRQAGFTEEEINRIPVGIMEITKIEMVAGAIGITIGATALSGGIYWLWGLF